VTLEGRKLDQLVRIWWLGTRSEDLVARILDSALGAEGSSVVPLARALQILEKHAFSPKLQTQVQEVDDRLGRLRKRELQLDDLGDIHNEPAALFKILGEDVSNLQRFDPDALRQARHAHAQDRFSASAEAFLDNLGWEQLPADTRRGLSEALNDLREREDYESWGLFVNRATGDGVALGVRLVKQQAGGGKLWADADGEMQVQVSQACRAAELESWEADLEWRAGFEGNSIGLPMYVAALVCQHRLPRHALTASTGRLEVGGRITAVTGIAAKIDAARRIGVRRVLVPQENLEEAQQAAGTDLAVIPIANIHEVLRALRQPLSSIELGYSELISLLKASIPEYQLVLQKESEEAHGRRLVVANAEGSANIWIYRNRNVWAAGKSGPALESAQRLIAERVPPAPKQHTPFKFNLPTAELQTRYQSALQEAGAVSEPARAHELWRLQLTQGRSQATVVLYRTGSCVVMGADPAWQVAIDAAREVTAAIGGIPDMPNSAGSSSGQPGTNSDSEPHIGTDEAGKGDYFGPLVSAAVYVDAGKAAQFREMGVRDSKTLSDKRVRQLAREIKQAAEGWWAVTAIFPRKYNELWAQFRREHKNLNSLLAWGHERSIRTLLRAPASRGIQAKYVVVDQFADTHHIEDRTERAGVQIPIHQRHKAESDIAVAAASILARDGFLQWMERWSELTQIPLPKGASPQVIEAAKQFVRRWGAQWLGDVAKVSFRTTRQVLEGETDHADSPPPPWSDAAADESREG
jgi:ribonuclease HIII